MAWVVMQTVLGEHAQIVSAEKVGRPYPLQSGKGSDASGVDGNFNWKFLEI